MLKYLDQIPAYQSWKSSDYGEQENNLLLYQVFSARVDQMLCFLDVAWPEFIEKEGLVLRKNNLPESWNHFLHQAQQAKWSQSDIEYMINHLHVSDLFLNDPDRDEIDTQVFAFLAQTISDMWKYRLESLYPEKNFVVGVENIETDPEVYAYLQRQHE